METCKYCGKICKDKHGLASHIRLRVSCYEQWKLDEQKKQIEYDNTHTFVQCKICGQKLRNISNTHLKKHNITQQEYKKLYPNEPLFADGLLEEQKQKREKTLNEHYVDENGKRTNIFTLEKCLQKYGEDGYKIWNEIYDKVGTSLTKFIKRHGEDEGLIRYNNFCEKLRGKRTLEYFINKYGNECGEQKYKEYHKKFKNYQTLDWFINKYGEEEGTLKYRNACKNKALTLDNFIRLYGKELGEKKYFEYYENKYHSFEQSKPALDLFNTLIQNNSIAKHKIWFYNNPKEFGKYVHNLKRYVFFDFFDETTNKIIEFNGDYWHANPLIYQADSLIHMPNKTIQTACDIWDRDNVRYIEVQKEFGYEILIIWEKEWKENPDFIIDKCLNFLTK